MSQEITETRTQRIPRNSDWVYTVTEENSTIVNDDVRRNGSSSSLLSEVRDFISSRGEWERGRGRDAKKSKIVDRNRKPDEVAIAGKVTEIPWSRFDEDSIRKTLRDPVSRWNTPLPFKLGIKIFLDYFLLDRRSSVGRQTAFSYRIRGKLAVSETGFSFCNDYYCSFERGHLDG